MRLERISPLSGWLPKNDNSERPDTALGHAQLRWDNVRLMRWLYSDRPGSPQTHVVIATV